MKYLFSPYGRARRRGFWLFCILYIAVTFGSVEIDRFFGFVDTEYQTGPIEFVTALVFLWPSIAVSVRRFHDVGMSGWWVLWFPLLTIPIVFIAALVLSLGGIADGIFENITAIEPGAPLSDLPIELWIIGGLALIPTIVQLAILFFVPGNDGENEYGTDLRGTRS